MYNPPPKRNIAYASPVNVTMNDEGALVETLRNHLLSENDKSPEVFLILLDIFALFLN